ncbi:MAG: lipocalin-like domain-containing protein [Muribaculaceae bacterium]|nr:lipocalin-like domain-containing protein [Muribaculaceae bacterium]
MEKLRSTIKVLVFILLCGCTQNDGYIGPIFGSWSLVAIMEDGTSIDPGDETIFSFQNEVVRVVRLVNPPYSAVTKFGSFTLSDDVLTLMFQQGPTPSGSYMYMAPDWLHFPKGETVVPLNVRKLNGSEMVLTLDNGGKIFEYSFKKTW